MKNGLRGIDFRRKNDGHEAEKLWEVYFYLDGSLDAQPDTQSPFPDPGASSKDAPQAEFSRDTDLLAIRQVLITPLNFGDQISC